MTLITYIKTKESIFLVGDGRITKQAFPSAPTYFESFHKVFLTETNIGIAYMGDAGYSNEEEFTPFILERLVKSATKVKKISALRTLIHSYFKNSGFNQMNLTFIIARFSNNKKFAIMFELQRAILGNFDGTYEKILIENNINSMANKVLYYNFIEDKESQHKKTLDSLFKSSYKLITGQRFNLKNLYNLTDDLVEKLIVHFYDEVYKSKEAKRNHIGGEIKLLCLKKEGAKWLRTHKALIAEAKA